MSQIREIELSDGSFIFVEMQEAELPQRASAPKKHDLPDGAEECGAKEKLVDAMQVLKNMLGNMADTVYEGIKKTKPDEWQLELNIGFKGTANPIPVILSGSSEVAIKVTAKWKKISAI